MEAPASCMCSQTDDIIARRGWGGGGGGGGAVSSDTLCKPRLKKPTTKMGSVHCDKRQRTSTCPPLKGVLAEGWGGDDAGNTGSAHYIHVTHSPSLLLLLQLYGRCAKRRLTPTAWTPKHMFSHFTDSSVTCTSGSSSEKLLREAPQRSSSEELL